MTSSQSEKQTNPTLVVGVTAGMSAITLLRGQLAWFQNHGWKVILVADADSQSRFAADREGVELFAIPMRRDISLFRDAFSLLKWLIFLRKTKPEAVNLGTPKAALLGMIAAWCTRVPRRLYTVRGLRLEGSTGFTAKILWFMEWLTMQLATDVLFISPSLQKECERRKLIPRGKTWLNGSGSSNGVDAPLIQSKLKNFDSKDIRYRLGISAEAFVIGFVGRVNRDKGVDTITRALKQEGIDKSVIALLVGPYEDADLEDELSQFKEQVVMVGWQEDVTEYYIAMDILCLPSRREGFPNVVIEAAAAGVPAITTNATGVKDSVIPGKTGFLIDVDDSESLASHINYLRKNPQKLKTLGESARQRAMDDFKPEHIWLGINEILTARKSPYYARKIWPLDGVKFS